MMVIDVSQYQGLIDWAKVPKEVTGVILRSTVADGTLDKRLVENYQHILLKRSNLKEISVYKFAYTRTYAEARQEAYKTILALKKANIAYDYFYLDLEGFGGRDFTSNEISNVIFGYYDALRDVCEENKLRLYFNYNYLCNIVPSCFHHMPIWLARYKKEMGDIKGANVVLWQYTSTGRVNGIVGDVDISKEVTP